MKAGMGSRRRPLLVALVIAALVCAWAPSAGALGLQPYFPPVAHNPADRLLQAPLEDYRYDRALHCRKTPAAGILVLQSWLERDWAGQSWGIMRCEKLGPHNYSLHAEGRALDWHLDARVPADRRAGERLISLLLAEDRGGNPHALARRMGVQEIIWDCKSWWSGAEGLERYSACYNRHGKRRRHLDATTAHIDHVHLGLNLPGARRQTSFWQR
jgi:hypothetical protein